MISQNVSQQSDLVANRIQSGRVPERSAGTRVRSLPAILSSVVEKLTPLSALQEYVAVNPMAGFTGRSLLDARELLRRHSDADLLLPIAYYRQLIADGRLAWDDVEAAARELRAEGIDAPTIADISKAMAVGETQQVDANRNRIRTVSELVDAAGRSTWRNLFEEEISSLCSDYFDEGQAVWKSSDTKLSLYHAWREKSKYDRNLEVFGLKGFRAQVEARPVVAEAAIEHSLRELRVPEHLWESYLLVHCFSTFGWSAWCRSASERQQDQGQYCDYLVDLLAIRLTMESILADSVGLQLDWEGIENDDLDWTQSDETVAMRNLLLRATELRFRDSLLASLKEPPVPSVGDRPLAQFAFCIDVRSERFRRALEASQKIQTVGVAGFFNLPMGFQRQGEENAVNERPDQQLPVLLKPQFTVCEEPVENAIDHAGRRVAKRSWHKYWRQFAKLPLSAFALVETLGTAFSWQFVTRKYSTASDRRATNRPTLNGLEVQGIDLQKQADLMETLLRNMGITKDFGRFVVICGHESRSANNPLHASLECGACGGHSGEVNARLAALMLNDPALREILSQRGVDIPIDTFFLAAVHETQSDELYWFDLECVRNDYQSELSELQEIGVAAAREAVQERSQSEGSSVAELQRKGNDWSEVRPEWGLAGNAAFIAAPRNWTRGIDLGGRAFLHEYDASNDPQGDVLESILTAPVVVAHWINFQYYASCVDQKHFGSDSKTIHNVVGKFGILSGGGGDLRTGLPWESLHNGERFEHEPIRLQVVIAADRDQVESLLLKHQPVRQLILGQWLHLMVVEGNRFYRLNSLGEWSHC